MVRNHLVEISSSTELQEPAPQVISKVVERRSTIRVTWGVTTVTEPTPIRPIPTCLRPSRVILNHSRAPNTKPEPSDPLASQQHTPEHSDSLASSQRIPDPTHPRPFLSLAPSRFPTTTLIPDPTAFDLLSSCVSLIPDVHRSRDCGRAKPDRVPPSLDAS